MNNARKQLIERFRSSAIERLRRIALELGSQPGTGESGAPVQVPESILRELHTVKGEARLLGLRPISGALHELEGILRPEPGAPRVELSKAIEPALEVIAKVLRELGESPADEEPPRDLPSEKLPSPQPRSSAERRWVHVSLERIDKLCDGAAELETTFRALYAQAQSALGAKQTQSVRELLEELERYRSQFEDVTSQVWALRMAAIEPLLVELAYHADELARGQKKRVQVKVQSGSVQLERSILDALREPLLHLLRNAIDHGIEHPEERGDKPAESTLHLRAESSAANVILTLSDDGRGIDLREVRAAATARGLLSQADAETRTDDELYALLFRPGFSTRSGVTDLSGRGMGLDVVRSTIESLGGGVELTTAVGAGTTFRLTLPMRLSRERALVFGYAQLLYAIPARQVLDLVSLREKPTCEIVGGTALRHSGGVLPLSSMAAALGITASPEHFESFAVILSVGSQRWAFSIGGVIGDFELLRKPCDALLGACLGYSSSATLDDGRLVLFLHPAALLQRARDNRVTYKSAAISPKRRVLIVDDSVIIRHLISLVLSAGGYEVATAEDGRQALLRCEEWRPDLIVSDLDMPEMDGMEMLGHVRARWPALPCIIFTNHAQAELRQRAMALGAQEYVVKADFDQEAILHAVERVLRKEGPAA